MKNLHRLSSSGLLSLALAFHATAAPIANPDAYSTPEDQPLIIAAPGLIANDSANGSTGTLSAEKTTDPAHGTVQVNANGSFVYTPAANYAGPDSFQYRTAEATLPVTFTVDQPNSLLFLHVQSSVVVTGTTDDQTTVFPVSGTITAVIPPNRAPFSTAQIQTIDLHPATQVAVTICVAKIVGLCISSLTMTFPAQGLAMSMTAAQAGPAVPVDGAGVFSQTGNALNVPGNFVFSGPALSLLGLPSDQSISIQNAPQDFNNATITQSGATLHLSFPINLTQTLVDPAYTMVFHIGGTVRATAPLPPPAIYSNAATVTLNVTSVDDLPEAIADGYLTRQFAALNIPATAAEATDTLIPSGSVWKYATGASLGTAWRGLDFDATSWPGAAGPLGYGSAIPAPSTIPARANLDAAASASNPNYPTAYFRREFTLTTPFDTLQPRVEFQRDDACIIYVNGVEIYRDSTPYAPGGTLPFPATGEVAYATYAGATIPEADSLVYKSVTFSRALLREGKNVIAAEVHQASNTSSDLRFDLRALRTTGVAGVLSNDSDPDSPAMSVSLWSPPANGTVALNADGSFTYAPRSTFPASGASGTDTFIYAHRIGGQWALQDSTVVPFASAWKFRDNGAAAPQDAGITAADWRNAAFDDAAWSSGAGQFGYGDGDEATLVEDDATPGSPTSGSTTRYITTYFRRTFTYSGNAALLNSLTVRMIRDDGVVIWLNGTRLVKDNLPDSWGHTTVALRSIDGAEETTPVEVTSLPAAALRTGVNVLAVEIHQSAADSSDISFDMELRATSAIGAAVDIVVLNDDLDGDAMSDMWERSFGLNDSLPNGAADADSDGMSNLDEWRALTSPTSAASVFTPAFATAGEDFTIAFPTATGRNYRLRESTNLSAWSDATGQPLKSGTGAPQAFTVPSSGIRRYYQVVPSIP